MGRLFWMLFIMIGTACAGGLVIAVLSMPSLPMDQRSLIPLAAVAGAALGAIISFVIAKRITASVV